MTKKKITDERLKRVQKEDAKKKSFKVREGQEKSSVWGDKERLDESNYPRPKAEDKQYKNQPEFTQRDSNKSKRT